MKWNDQFYIDPMLPFGLRSDPKSTCRRPRMVVERGRVRNDFHYLDIPLAAHKCEGSSICVTFLGIVIDTATGELRLPPEKLVHLRNLLSKWGDRKACGRRELESLIGYLNHACKVIRPGRSFLRRIIDLLHRNPNTYHPIHLNCQFRSDLQWWKSFAAGWNSTSYITTNSSTNFASDASGSWGCGAWHGTSWFQWRWGPISGQQPIAVNKLIPILIAALIWGRSWSRQKSSATAITRSWSRLFGRGQVLKPRLCICCDVYSSSRRLLTLVWPQSTLRALTMPLRTHYLRITCTPFRWCREPAEVPHPFIHKRWRCYWTQPQNGPHQPGCSSSGLFP